MAKEQAAQAETESGLAPALEPLAEASERVAGEFMEGLMLKHLGAGVRDALLELFRHRPKAWAQMNEGEQRDAAYLIESAVENFLAQAVEAIAADGRPYIAARLEKFTVKAGKFGIALASQGGPDLAAGLARLDGHDVLIISADATDFTRPLPADIAPDQAPLSFDEEPEPEHDPETGEILDDDEPEAETAEEEAKS